jgi:hypothetical protein
VGPLAAILALGVALVLARAARNPAVSRLTLVAVAFAFAMWNGIPTLAYLFLPWDRIGPGLDEAAYARVLVIENAAFLAVCLVLLLRRPFLPQLARSPLARSTSSDRVVLTALLVAIAGSVAARTAANDLFGASYFERNAFAMTGDDASIAVAGAISVVLALANAIGYGCLIRPVASPRIAKAVLALGMAWVAYGVVDDLRAGSRIAVLVPLMVVVFRMAVSGRTSTSVLRLWGSALVSVAAAAVLSIAVRETRGANDVRVHDLTMTTGDLMERSSLSDLGTQFIEELTVKFNAPLGGLLLLQTEGEGAGGWMPFAGALLTLVPRYFLPEKPVPGSSNGHYSGHPSRIVAARMGFQSDVGNMGVSVAAVAQWELGYSGLALLVLLGWINLVVLNSLLSGSSLAVVVFGLMMCGVPAFGSVIASPDVAIQVVMRALAMVAVLTALRVLIGSWRRSPSPAIAPRQQVSGR